MEAPHDDLPSKWGVLGAAFTAAAAFFAWLRALAARKRDQSEEPLTLRSLDKRVRGHDQRLDRIDLHLEATDARQEEHHGEVMRELRELRRNLGGGTRS